MDHEVIHIHKGLTGDALLDQQDDKMDKRSSMNGGYEYIHAYDDLALNTEMIAMTILAMAIICFLLCIASCIGCFVVKKLKQLSFQSTNNRYDKLPMQKTRSVDNV